MAIVKSFDNRKLDESTALAWKMMLDREVPEARLEDAQEVVLDWFSTANPYFEVRHLVDGLKRSLRLAKFNIASDVRSARARGMVDASWPESKALPWPVRDELAKRRAAEREARHELEEAGPNVSPLALDVGRRV